MVSHLAIGTEVNTDKARMFREIVTAGWNNKSEGHVDSTTGHFALINIEANELPELREAVFGDAFPDDDLRYLVGYHVLVEDSDGNATLHHFSTEGVADIAYRHLSNDFAVYLLGGRDDDPVMVCQECGEVFDDLKCVHEHITSVTLVNEECATALFLVTTRGEAM